jgi:hypothetical protein
MAEMAATAHSYTASFTRAFRQAPWRTQTQAVAMWSVILLIIAVVGGLYLAVASRAGTAGRDLQSLEVRKAELIRQNNELRATLSQLRSIDRMANRARQLGFVPAEAQAIEYLPVHNYPAVMVQAPEPAAATAAGSWFSDTFGGLLGAAGRGG